MKTQFEIWVSPSGKLEVDDSEGWRYLKLNAFHRGLLLSLLNKTQPKGWNEKHFCDSVREFCRQDEREKIATEGNQTES